MTTQNRFLPANFPIKHLNVKLSIQHLEPSKVHSDTVAIATFVYALPVQWVYYIGTPTKELNQTAELQLIIPIRILYIMLHVT